MRQSVSDFDMIKEVEEVKKQYLLEWLFSNGGIWKENSSMWIESFFSETANRSSEFDTFTSQIENYKAKRYS